MGESVQENKIVIRVDRMNGVAQRIVFEKDGYGATYIWDEKTNKPKIVAKCYYGASRGGRVTIPPAIMKIFSKRAWAIFKKGRQ